MIPDYPWFGPRHGAGWGWTPLSWEGKALCLAVFVVCLIAALARGRSKATFYVIGGSVVFLLIVCAITGTAPG